MPRWCRACIVAGLLALMLPGCRGPAPVHVTVFGPLEAYPKLARRLEQAGARVDRRALSPIEVDRPTLILGADVDLDSLVEVVASTTGREPARYRHSYANQLYTFRTAGLYLPDPGYPRFIYAAQCDDRYIELTLMRAGRASLSGSSWSEAEASSEERFEGRWEQQERGFTLTMSEFRVTLIRRQYRVLNSEVLEPEAQLDQVPCALRRMYPP